MAFKLKFDEKGVVVLQEGKPVYVNDEGKDIAFDMNEATNKIHTLNEENKTRRLELETVSKKFKDFEGLDIEQIKKNADIAVKFNESEMTKNGEIDKLKAEILATSQKQLDDTRNGYESKLSALSEANQKLTSTLDKNILNNHFLNSKYVKDNLIVPPDMVMAMFGDKFKIDRDNGKITGIGDDGTQILSVLKITEVADFEEALELMVAKYPHKNQILKADSVSGGGMSNNGRGGGNFSIEDKIIKDPKASTSQRLEAARRKQRANGGN